MKIQSSPKFEFLDGIRGISALYVAFYHAQLFSGHNNDYLRCTFIKPLSVLISFGHFSVAVFIVLSGFCLTIPVALSENKSLKGGFKRYISRRFIRIVPPYYVALLLMLLFIWFTPIMQIISNTAWDSKIPVTLWSIISHIFLIHNFSANWIIKIDGPMWSVATEWQIYFIFPLLIWLWRKYEITGSIIIANILGVLLALKFSLIHPWYIGLFSFGMGASIICFSKDKLYEKLRTFNWSLFSKISTAAIIILFIAITLKDDGKPIISETLVGFFISIIIINLTLSEINQKKRTLLLRFFNYKPVITLGAFSYSIYLIHSPILAFINLMALKTSIDINIRLLLMFFVAVPIAVAISYLFYLIVERNFIPSKKDKQQNVNEKVIDIPLENQLAK